jgi:hypothetical protein
MLKKLLGPLLIILLISAVSFAENITDAISYQFNSTQIEQLKSMVTSDADAKKIYNKIRSTADKALNPDPDPIEKIQTEGKLDSDPVKKATQNSLKDMQPTYFLSMVYILTDDAKYLAKAKEYIMAWAKTNQPAIQSTKPIWSR